MIRMIRIHPELESDDHLEIYIRLAAKSGMGVDELINRLLSNHARANAHLLNEPAPRRTTSSTRAVQRLLNPNGESTYTQTLEQIRPGATP